MKYILCFPLLIAMCIAFNIQKSHAQADTLTAEVDTYDAQIEYEIIDNSFHFTPDIRPLVPIPGARKAFYTYLWDFGDGNFSTEESPSHIYEKPGEYKVKLYATNNYDNGPPPKRPTRSVQVNSQLASNNKTSNPFKKNFFSSNEVFQLFKNSDALPGTDIALIAGVRPHLGKGTIMILTNEKALNPDGFSVAYQSTYNQEQIDSSALFTKDKLNSMWASVNKVTQTRSGSPDYGEKVELDLTEKEAIAYFSELYDTYKTMSVYEIDAPDADDQFSIINLDVTEDMLADTNAIVTVTGVYIPEDGIASIHKLDIPVVTSHDPNKMSVRPARLHYRTQFKKKKLTYKVQFQNDGEGDAKQIRLDVHLPDEIDPHTFTLLNLYPAVDSCLTENSKGCYTYKVKENNTLEFLFKDIALPGSEAPDISDIDSTRGFIRFEAQSYKKLKNKPLKGYTDIYFDKNDPIRTNHSTARFLPGLSPFVKLGLNSPLSKQERENSIFKNSLGLDLSFGVSPIAPYKKPYWQVEVNGFTYTETETRVFHETGEMKIEPSKDLKKNFIQYHQIDSITRSNYLRLSIPVQVRYNFNGLVSAGIGMTVGKDFNLNRSEEAVFHLSKINGDENVDTYKTENKLNKTKSNDIYYAPFVDFNIGSTYLGPAFGVRYLYDNKIKHNGQFYLIWRL